jgi:uncharacterized protein
MPIDTATLSPLARTHLRFLQTPIPQRALLEFQMINYQAIWRELTSRFPEDLSSIHGPEHWRRVEDVGLKIVRMTGRGDADVVRMFAVLHDSCRLNDNNDPEHGIRAADYAEEMRGRLFDLDDRRFKLLHFACMFHANGDKSADSTIGTCWDADRLDLRRVGIEPDLSFFSTPELRRT